MHRSRVHAIVIDCDDFDAGVRFWSHALGVEPQVLDEQYVALQQAVGGLLVLLQRVPEPKTCKSRVHLDFETDHMEAELQRLEALGARRVKQYPNWWTMQDPCGNEFCVANQHGGDFAEKAKVWNG